MPKMVRAVARTLLMFVFAVAVVFLGLRTYVSYKIHVAQSAIADFQRLITSASTQEQIDQFMKKYHSSQHDHGIVIRSPSFPLLVGFNEIGDCEFHRADSVIGGLGQEILIRLADSVGYSCFVVWMTMDKLPSGQIQGFLSYEPARSRPLLIRRTDEQVSDSGHPKPYRIAEGSHKGLMGVLVGRDTPPEIASSITQVNVSCLRRFKGCSFSELLPAAALRCASDQKEGFEPCR